MTAAKTYPTEPTDIAAAAVDAITIDRRAFDMRDWCRVSGGIELPPDYRPSCGTTLCAAAWIAHVTGWTLLNGGVCWRDGYDSRYIMDVANEALGLPSTFTDMWHASEETAFNWLLCIAGRK
jgi:hypothetical protein